MTRDLEFGRKAPRSGKAKSLVVFLHGYGADGADLLGLAEPLGPHPDLRGRFLSRDIDHGQTRLRKAGSGLKQQGGFADTGITADQTRSPY